MPKHRIEINQIDSSTSILFNKFQLMNNNLCEPPEEDTSVVKRHKTSDSDSPPPTNLSQNNPSRKTDIVVMQAQYRLTIEPFVQLGYSAKDIYLKVMGSDDRGPAILHKIRDEAYLRWDDYHSFPTWNEMKETGRVYSPQVHCWAFNTVWMLAHIHKQSQFMIISPVITEYVMREFDKSRRYSAFAKEIVVAMKAGYVVTKITYQGCHEVTHLTPTRQQSETIKMTVKDCDLDPQSCREGIQSYYNAVTQYRRTFSRLASSIANTISDTQINHKTIQILDKTFGENKLLNLYLKINNDYLSNKLPSESFISIKTDYLNKINFNKIHNNFKNDSIKNFNEKISLPFFKNTQPFLEKIINVLIDENDFSKKFKIE